MAWSDLPPELLLQILEQAAWSCPKAALAICTLSKAIYAVTHAALYRIICLRSRSALHAYAGSLNSYPERADALTDLYLCNRSASATLEKALLDDVDENSGSSLLPQPSQHHDSNAALRFVFQRCRRLEHLHVWEPFSIGYPSELSGIHHVCPYPIELLRQALQAQLEHQIAPEHDRGTTSPLPLHLTSLRRLTISAQALQPADLSSLTHLKHLHLQWPTLSPGLLSSLSALIHLSDLRLTRPAPYHLLEGVRLLCRGSLRRIDIELGLYIEEHLVVSLAALRSELASAPTPQTQLRLFGQSRSASTNSSAQQLNGHDAVTDGMEAGALIEFRADARHGCACDACEGACTIRF